MSTNPVVTARPRLRVPAPSVSILPVRALLTTLLFATLFARALTADPPAPSPAATPPTWSGRLSSTEPGAFAPVRSYRADYRVAWNGLEAARVEASVSAPADGPQIRTAVKAFTTGAARLLYKLDATHVSVVDRVTLHPQSLEQTERGASKNTVVSVAFTPQGATRTERDLDRKDGEKSRRKPKSFPYPGLLDMEGVFLEFRSLPLAEGDERTYLFMTSGSPYLATLKVVGHGSVHVSAGDFPAIQCSLKLEKINKNGTLEPRKGFKSGYAWLSDDADRILIKAQTDIFIGAVYLELESVAFTDAKP